MRVYLVLEIRSNPAKKGGTNQIIRRTSGGRLENLGNVCRVLDLEGVTCVCDAIVVFSQLTTSFPAISRLSKPPRALITGLPDCISEFW